MYNLCKCYKNQRRMKLINQKLFKYRKNWKRTVTYSEQLSLMKYHLYNGLSSQVKHTFDSYH